MPTPRYYKFNDVLGEGDFNRQACIWFSFAVLCFTPSYTAGGCADTLAWHGCAVRTHGSILAAPFVSSARHLPVSVPVNRNIIPSQHGQHPKLNPMPRVHVRAQ